VLNIRRIERAEITLSAGEAELTARHRASLSRDRLGRLCPWQRQQLTESPNPPRVRVLDNGGIPTLLVDLPTEEKKAVGCPDR